MQASAPAPATTSRPDRPGGGASPPRLAPLALAWCLRLVRCFSALAGLLTKLLAWALAPPRCAACDELVTGEVVFCPACARTIERSTSPLASLRYGGAVKIAIRRFKYGDRPDLAEPLGHLLVAALRARRSGPRLVVPVPLHVDRLAERGFNQSALLARVVADLTGWSTALGALERVKRTRAQAKLGKDERRCNVAGAFRARKRLEGADVLLVDDVTTTGSTLAAAAEALRRAGARSVVPLTIAVQELEP